MLDYSKPTPPLPDCLSEICNRIVDVAKGIARTPSDSFIDMTMIENHPINQLTINEYLPGQGIASHIGNLLLI